MKTRPHLGRFLCCWRAEECAEQSVQSGLHDPIRSTEHTDGNCKVSIDCPPIKVHSTDACDEEEPSSPATSYGSCIVDFVDHGSSETDRLADLDGCSISSNKSGTGSETTEIRTYTQAPSSAPRTPERCEGHPGRPRKAGRLTPAHPLEPQWMDTELGVPPAKRRERLPEPKEKLPSVNIFSLVRDWLGKDVHKLALPTHLSEPLTDLQRRVEAFESSEMLDQAALLPSESLERLLQVSAFVISMYNTVKRLDKPFRNLQNSTFELVYPEKGLRAIGEKVCHYPITSAMHVEGRGWTFNANDSFQMVLRPNYAMFRPAGEFYLTFHDGDTYSWTPVNTYGHNIVWGKLYIDHGGPFGVTCLGTGDSMQGCFEHSLFRKSTKQVSMHLVREGQRVHGIDISGIWDKEIWAEYSDGTKKQLWAALSPHATSSKFLFSLWALHLNELTPELRAKLPPTDDRLRPDMRLMEHGYYLAANDEKQRLEAKQRQERSAAEAAGTPWQPRWFEKVPGGRRGYEVYKYKGGYWEARESSNWQGLRHIYGPGPDNGSGPQSPPELLL